jgi:RNA polymerase sigma-70 factor (ECF subfamily)
MNRSAIELLLEKLNSGDEQAAAQVFQTYEPLLRKVVRRRLPAQVQARIDSCDIVQSAWADLLTGFREARWHFRDAVHLRAFLIRVVECRLYDRARRALGQTRREEPFPGEPPSPQPRPSELAQADAVWEQMLALCPPEHNAILRLRRAGFTLQEIADRTGLHEGSVRRLLRQLARHAVFAG